MAQLRVTGKALPSHNRQHNRALVLQILFHEGAMSRADLARASGLTRVTVSDLVSDLESEDLIRELGRRADARVGKPATLLAIDEDSHHIIGLDLSADDIFSGAVMNLNGKILHRQEVALDGATGAAAIEAALALAEELKDRASARLLGIGIGTPGVVDRAGLVTEAPNLGWTDVDLRAAFAARFALPVHIANDANTAALAVHTFHKLAARSFMLVTIGHGVGAGLIIDGALVEGDRFTAGEIGHVVVDEDGELCQCGRRGCLEMAVAVPHLKQRLKAASAGQGDTVLAEAGGILGDALSPVIAALGLNRVVLAGPATLLGGAFLDATVDTVRRRTLESVTRGLEMTVADDDDDLILRGASVLVLSAELGIS